MVVLKRNKIVMLPFDFSSNAISRTILIGEILSEFCEVYIIGLASQTDIWLPAKEKLKNFHYLCLKSEFYGLTFSLMKNIRNLLAEINNIQPDVVYAFKPLPTSYGLGLLYRLKESRTPLLLDIDDWELGFALDAGWRAPVSLFITSSMEHLVRFSNVVTFSSYFLKHRFGGYYLPHVVDTDLYDPSKYDREEIRQQLGIYDETVISFIGTPRKHKGVDIIILALNKLLEKSPHLKKIKFLFTGDPQDSYVRFLINLSTRLLGKERTLFLGMIPKTHEPPLLAASDIVCIPQEVSYASLGQVPAKVFTAMSMAKPIIASAVSDLPIILKGCGIIIPPKDINALAEGIIRLIENPQMAKMLGQYARIKCVEKYSYITGRKILRNILDKVLSGEFKNESHKRAQNSKSLN
jgi:glycosyltransferase involved in cell wall biosynthesis